MVDYKKDLRAYLDREIAVIQKLDLDSINVVMNVLEEAKANHKTTYICGNGGSAATASHFVCDFNKGLNDEASQFKFQCLSDNTPIMMAIPTRSAISLPMTARRGRFCRTARFITSMKMNRAWKQPVMLPISARSSR